MYSPNSRHDISTKIEKLAIVHKTGLAATDTSQLIREEFSIREL